MVLRACNFRTEVLSNDDQDEECEFTVKDDGYEDTGTDGYEDSRYSLVKNGKKNVSYLNANHH